MTVGRGGRYNCLLNVAQKSEGILARSFWVSQSPGFQYGDHTVAHLYIYGSCYVMLYSLYTGNKYIIYDCV